MTNCQNLLGIYTQLNFHEIESFEVFIEDHLEKLYPEISEFNKNKLNSKELRKHESYSNHKKLKKPSNFTLF